MLRSTTAVSSSVGNIVLKFVGNIFLYGTLLSVAVASCQYIVDSKRDIRERTFQFHDLVMKADEMYCQTEATGVQVRTRVFIDRAAKLEPDIKDELIPLDYMILASVGSSFWPYDRAHAYGLRALHLGIQDDDRIEKYAAELVLGHIDFMQFHASKMPAFHDEARQHFKQAEQLVTYDTSYQNLHFAGQLYLLWAQHELFAGNSAASDELFKTTESVFRSLPQNSSSVYRIAFAKKSVEDGIPPRLPCPSQITVSPPLRDNPSLAETQMRESTNDDPPIVPQPDLAEDSKLNDRISKIEGNLESLDNKFNDQVSSLRNLIVNKQEANERVPEKPNPQPPDTPPHNGNVPPVPSPPSTDSLDCSFKIFNNSNYYIRPIINGVNNAKYNIPPGEVVEFNCGCNDWLRLTHRHNGYQTSWPPSVFWKIDGSQAVPLIEMTTCGSVENSSC